MTEFFMCLTLVVLLTTLCTTVFFPDWKVNRKKYEDQMELWFDFVTAQINTCKNWDHLDHCQELIALFDQWFYGQVPDHVREERIEILFNRLATRRDSLYIEEGAGTVLTNAVLD